MLLDSFKNISDHSKIWIYCFNKNLNSSELQEIKLKLDDFTQDWTAHNSKLIAKGSLVLNHFIILAVDEETATASGCSIDKSIYFLKTLMQDYGIDLFNRNLMALYNNKDLTFVELPLLKTMLANHQIDGDLLFFDNTMNTLVEARTKWLKPINESWFYKQLIA